MVAPLSRLRAAFPYFALLALFVLLLPLISPVASVLAAPARASAQTQSTRCALYPIAIRLDVLEAAAIGDVLAPLANGTQPGNFGWISWTGEGSVQQLAESLTPPGNSETYINPLEPSDHLVSVGDWLQGRPGAVNSGVVRQALEQLKGTEITVPVWDRAQSAGAQTQYRVVKFASVRLVEYQLAKPSHLGAQFLGYNSFCGDAPQLTATATKSPTALPTNTATHTTTALPSETATAPSTATDTATPIPTNTATPEPTETTTSTATALPTHTALPTETATNTATALPTQTAISTQTPTRTATVRATNTATPLPSSTPSPLEGATLDLLPLASGPNVISTTHTLTATLLTRRGEPLVGFTVVFNMTGVHTTTTSGVTNAAGEATLTYMGSQEGTDTVQVQTADSSLALTATPAQVSWLVPAQTFTTSPVSGGFFVADGSGVFNTLPTNTPVFEQTFSTINFNPGPGAAPGNTTVSTRTFPFTNVTTDLNGFYTGKIIAQGNGYQAGDGALGHFNAVFLGEFTLTEPKEITFRIYHDDGFILGIGNGAVRVGGANHNPPASGLTAFRELPVMGAFNVITPPVGHDVTVFFPEPGVYPYEIDYSQGPRGDATLTVTTVELGMGVPPSGVLTITPNAVERQPAGGLQTLTVTATDAAGGRVANLPVQLNLTGMNAQEFYGHTDATGQVSFTYKGQYEGEDRAQAIAWVSGSALFSNEVVVPWHIGALPDANAPLSIPGWLGIPTSESVVSGTVPIGLAPGREILYGSIDYWPVDDPSAVKVLAPHVERVGVLTTLDTTLLENGSYIVRLRGVDRAFRPIPDSGVLITVEGEYKPGRVRFTVTDLKVPVVGLPIAIERTYDSLTRERVGDFGHGWTLSFGNPRLQVNQAHDVTLTLPNGRRTTFHFTPYPGHLFLGFLLFPKYTPEAGVYGTLTANGCGLV
nr:Ig-like domain-containing protein [Ardenticatenales bacterium]